MRARSSMPAISWIAGDERVPVGAHASPQSGDVPELPPANEGPFSSGIHSPAQLSASGRRSVERFRILYAPPSKARNNGRLRITPHLPFASLESPTHFPTHQGPARPLRGIWLAR